MPLMVRAIPAILLGAALQLVAVALAGFAAGTPGLPILVAVSVLVCPGLRRGRLWAAWIGFLAMIAGLASAMGHLAGPSGLLPAWALWGVAGANGAAALLLFGAIWRGPAPRGPA